MALYKVPTHIIAAEVQVERLLSLYGARVVVIRTDYTVFSVTGQREETDKMIKILEPYGLIEFVRSARVAIIKDSEGFHRKRIPKPARQDIFYVIRSFKNFKINTKL